MANNRNAISTRQVDWNCEDQSSPEYIKNKPTTKPVTAGANIIIEETDEKFTISSNGGGSSPEYTAGEGIEISGDTISVNTDAIQTKLTAGTNIDMTNGIVSTGKAVVAAGDNVTVSSSLDTLNNIVTYTVNATGGGQSSSSLKYSIDTSSSISWDAYSTYASGMFVFNDGGDNDGISYWVSDNKKLGYQLEVGHVYQLNFNINITQGGTYGQMIPGYVYITGPQEQTWYFQLDGSQSEDLSLTGSTILKCSSSTWLAFNARISASLSTNPTMAIKHMSIVDLTALSGAN